MKPHTAHRPRRTRIAVRGGFLYRWEIHIEKGNATLIENKRKVLQVVSKP